MEYIDNKMNIFIKFLKKTHLISVDFIYRIYFMHIFGSKLYYRHKITSFSSCAFCRHLSYDSIIKKYICSEGEYEACGSLVPCIIPESSFMPGKYYIEEETQIPWLFKETCINFEVLDSKSYYRNFLSVDLNSSVIRLEALEGILMGNCSGNIPCHICAGVNKEIYTKCVQTQKSGETCRCNIIYDKLRKCFSDNGDLSRVS
jgi:hypothetical protein